jgi:hypothetical protein
VGRVISTCKANGVLIASTFDTVPGFNNTLTIYPPLSASEEDLIFFT